jgi:hypothetical protein
MNRIKFLQLVGVAGLGMQPFGSALSWPETDGIAPSRKILGMYVHAGWPYNHPYSARTWTVEDLERKKSIREASPNQAMPIPGGPYHNRYNDGLMYLEDSTPRLIAAMQETLLQM